MKFFCFLFLFPAPSMNGSGLIVSTSDSRWCGQGWFPRRGVYEFAFQLFNMWGSRNERFYGKTWGKTTRGRGYVNFPWGPPLMMVLWKPWNEYRRFAFVLNFPKILHAHISGRQNKNKLKEKHAESREHPVNRVPTSFVSVNFVENMTDGCAVFGCTNWRSTISLQFYNIPSAKRYPEQVIKKWVTVKNDRLRK